MQLKFQKHKLLNGQTSRRSKVIPLKKANHTAQGLRFKSKTCILYTAQVPEGAHLYRSKTKNYTAQISNVKLVSCKRLKFQKELIPIKNEKLYSSSFRSKNLYTANGSSSRRISLIPIKNEKLYSSNYKRKTCILQTAQIPEGAYTDQKRKIIQLKFQE